MSNVIDDALIAVGSDNFSGDTNSVAYSYERAALPATAFGETMKGNRLGLLSFVCGAVMYFDPLDNANDETLFDDINLKTSNPFTVAYDSLVGSVAYLGLVKNDSYNFLGEVGTEGKSNLSFIAAENSPLARGMLALNGSAAPGTNYGSGQALGAIESGKQLVSNLHVPSVPGSGTLDVTVEGGTDSTFTMGKAWREITTNIANIIYGATNFNSTYINVVCGNGQIYAQLASDPFNETWTLNDFGTGNDFKGIASASSFVAAFGENGMLYTSPTGYPGTWTSRTSGVPTIRLEKGVLIAWGPSIAIVGTTGTIITAASSDPTTWTSRVSGTSNNLTGICSNGTNKLVAVGVSSTIINSADGVTWANAATIPAGNYRDIAYSGGTYIAVGDTGLVCRSTDGTNFTQQSIGTTGAIYGITKIASTWILTIFTGGIWYSTDDGVTWVGADSSEVSGNLYNAWSNVISSKNYALALGGSGSIGRIYFSTDAHASIITHTQVTTTKTSEQKTLSGQLPFSHYRHKNVAVTGTYSEVIHSIGKAEA